MSLSRAGRFLKRVMTVVLLIAVAVGAVVAIQLIAHPFDAQLHMLRTWLAQANTLIDEDLMSGISIGMIALVLLVAVIPLLMRNIDRSQYVVATQRGVISSIVFFLTEILYNWAEKISRFYLVVAMVGVILITFVIVETLSLLMHSDRKEEMAFRTDLLASFASGLVAGIVIKLIMVAFSH